MQHVSVIDAWESPAFFRPLFGKDLDSWKAWRSFGKALYGLPFEDEEEALLYQLGTLRETVPEGGFTEAYAVVGRMHIRLHMSVTVLTFAPRPTRRQANFCNKSLRS